MRTTVDHFATAEAVALDQARGLARTIADTLTAMYPSAAYLVLERDEDDADVLWLHSIRDVTGHVLCDFEPPSALPELTDAELRLAWGELDPQRPTDLLHLVRRLEDAGGRFDFLPDSAAREDDPGDSGPSLLCLLLCDQAEPGLWDWGGDAILRPYSAPRPPAGPISQA
ncbi:hypothetical protein HRW14_24460 [Streptomyces lunaelactis]|uniref:hypothetical protein n=1 Tax=Streptomyces lunaelactis TaxID=1535768 RepID=UPI0015852E25|nr:hypothetical protein [Streptomyces lunaelactis]NUK53368.1 hypothetical protein [Streptomyces lunaelactis]